MGIPLDVKIIPEYMKQHNYSSHMFGKWHLGFCSKKYTPLGRGFDTFKGRYIAVGNEKAYKERKISNKLEINKLKMQLEKSTRQLERSSKENCLRRRVLKRQQWKEKQMRFRLEKRFDLLQQRMGHYRIKWIYYRNQRRHRRSVTSKKRPPVMVSSSYLTDIIRLLQKSSVQNKPIFLYLSFFTKTYKVYSEFDSVQKRNELIKDMDDTVGVIMQHIKQLGQSENTIIAFYSDNGSKKFPKIKSPNFPLRGYKGSVYEGGTRVPAFLHIPFGKPYR